uniref:Uncharacterized protein n=1 Tax=viral metagenome TaxID=1070528 RepID=A0A6C0DYJ8_9ZZZZ
MSRVHTIQNYTNLNIVNITQNTTNNKNLVLDLWNFTNTKHSQIFLLLKDLKVVSSDSKKLVLDIGNNHDNRIAINHIEDKSIELLQKYMTKINKKGKFSFNSLVRELRFLEFTNSTFDIYDTNKKKIDTLDKVKCVDIIVEFIDINLDMVSGIINLNTNLTTVISKIVVPEKSKLNLDEIFFKDNLDYTSTSESETLTPMFNNKPDNENNDSNDSNDSDNSEDDDSDDNESYEHKLSMSDKIIVLTDSESN